MYKRGHACWTATSNRNVPISFELMSVFIFGLLCARVTCTVCAGVHEPTLTMLFASCSLFCWEAAAPTPDLIFIFLIFFLGAVPCSVSPSVAGGQRCACKTCGYFLLSCILTASPGRGMHSVKVSQPVVYKHNLRRAFAPIVALPLF